ncbi:MAG: GNAT family N-acetyltransferase [Anaerovoracaceae bacterium]
MEYIKATEKDIEQITTMVQETIKTIYPKYYPKEVVDFFCELHNKENIFKDIKAGFVGVLKKDDEIIGTGCYKENHITRVYVKPTYQHQGYGSYIMQCLENEISTSNEKVCLDASLPACHLYEKRGYKTIKHERWNVENGVILVYEVMEKRLTKCSTHTCYDGQ